MPGLPPVEAEVRQVGATYVLSHIERDRLYLAPARSQQRFAAIKNRMSALEEEFGQRRASNNVRPKRSSIISYISVNAEDVEDDVTLTTYVVFSSIVRGWFEGVLKTLSYHLRPHQEFPSRNIYWW